MKRFDRILGILLFLRGGQVISANDLARRFHVSARTVFRDLETLSQLGVPLYAERGREGGFRLVEGYFLPPVMFSRQEASVLLMGLLMMRHLRVTPFAAQFETAERKLLKAMPERLQNTLSHLKDIIGFEAIPADLFDHEMTEPVLASAKARTKEGVVVSAFLEALVEQKSVRLHYRSPYHHQAKDYHIQPRGLIWDRERWYLVGAYIARSGEIRLWRADRVLDLQADLVADLTAHDFQVGAWLGRAWLRSAMKTWREESPVIIQLSQVQAERLKQDWYYGHAHFESAANGRVLMTFGEDNSRYVLALVRWLGPGAELIEPKAWRNLLRAELAEMSAAYDTDE